MSYKRPGRYRVFVFKLGVIYGYGVKMRPSLKPQNPCFSSGPTRKRSGWSKEALNTVSLGRSHRSSYGIERIRHLVALTRDLLEIPDTYHVAIMPGSCTGAMEAALWSLLGPLPVDCVAFDVFGNLWVHDVLHELKVQDTRVFEALPGLLPGLSDINPSHDLVLTWNGTTAGVCIPNGDWISPDRKGLVICDATSALFAMPFPWEKMDAVAFSWQKALGGEAGHGMLVLSPRAVERLNSYKPPRPMPRLFRLTQDGKFSKDIFEGMTINTPSLMCIEDCIDTLTWCVSLGGLPSLIGRSQANLKAVEKWVLETPWIEFLASNPETRSSTAICVRFKEAPDDWELPKAIAALLEDEGVAFDILGHSRSVPGLRFWGGPTVEASDMEILLPWITWAHEKIT
jgi:phosphoserine aminotransferase